MADVEALRHPFRAIVFDWDGTAVANRQENAAALAGLIESLLDLGVWIVIVTGTNFGHVERQLGGRIPPSSRRRLIVCANRGSEVFGFDRRGAVVSRWARAATPDEDHALTAIAEDVRDSVVSRTGLEVGIVYDRLNRRKIDLIPLAEWADPPKSEIGNLLAAVQARLKSDGLSDGIAGVIDLTRERAVERGLPDARITSDVKHVEVGLTDKADSMGWIQRNLLRRGRIPWTEVLVVGDEFGPVAGFPGSDDRLAVGGDGAAIVSVGREPNGVPEGVIHLGGGPASFRRLLAEQVRLHEEGMGPSLTGSAGGMSDLFGLAATLDPSWCLEVSGFDPLREDEVESRLALGNGALGVRGSLEELTAFSHPRTFVAGLFDVARSDPPLEVLAPCPNWLRIRLILEGGGPDLAHGYSLLHVRTLDFRQGVLWREWRYRNATGHEIHMRTLRFASLGHRSLAVQVVQIEARRGRLTLELHCDPPLRGLELKRAESSLGVWRTANTRAHLAVATATRLEVDGRAVRPTWSRGQRVLRWIWPTSPDGIATAVRTVALAKGEPETDPGENVQQVVERARREGVQRLFARHARAWARHWEDSGLTLSGDATAQAALRFAVYHLVSAANPEDEHVSIGARALTGEGYSGHVFWDTEIFMLPFYIFTWPEAARALLMYRYHTLPAARSKAAQFGYRGALYAWESAGSGEEATPPYVIGALGERIPIYTGFQGHHISADVAYAVWQYWQATGDDEFMIGPGAEILFETAKFWASRAERDPGGRYHLRRVVGPDEYHEGVDDNAYTNVMAQRNLERAQDLARFLATSWPDRWQELQSSLGLTPSELDLWTKVRDGLVTGLDSATGLIEQFAGFFGLEHIDLTPYGPRTPPMDVLLGPERTRGSQVIKQADVLMLFSLLEERFPPEVRRANFGYYEPRCCQGSSLSPAIHAWVAARLGDTERAKEWFHEAAAIDLDDAMGNSAFGVHIAMLGGLWQAVVFGFAGLRLRVDGVELDPRLPTGWDELSFRLRWRGRRLSVSLQRAPSQVAITLEEGESVAIYVEDERRVVGAGATWSYSRPVGQGPLPEAER